MQSTPEIPGRFGPYGGRFVAETLMTPLIELERAFNTAWDDSAFHEEFHSILKTYVGRPTPLYFASRLSESVGAKIWLKREDLCHTGAHKINNTIGQGLLAKRMGKRAMIAETGAGQHGVATATACALMGLECEVFMGAIDVERQAPNVERMQMLGAKVRAVQTGSKTLKDAMNEALREWVARVETTHYCVGSAAGPHPYPTIVREFQSVIGTETRKQCLEQMGGLPKAVVACVGGGSNAIGIFSGFFDDPSVALVGVEAAGRGVDTPEHAATLTEGSVGVLHGAKSYMLQDQVGQVCEAHSVSAGLDYPGVGPQHAWLKDAGLATYVSVTDEQALDALDQLCLKEGIVPALESSHALAALADLAKTYPDENVVVCLSGRGDKDMATVQRVRAGGDMK